MDYHGGGFYLGSALEQAPFCAKLCRELEAVAISVDYRMAPLDKFPAAIEDADDVAKAALDPTSRAYQALREGIASFVRKKRDEDCAAEDDGKYKDMPPPPCPEPSDSGNHALAVYL